MKLIEGRKKKHKQGLILNHGRLKIDFVENVPDQSGVFKFQVHVLTLYNVKDIFSFVSPYLLLHVWKFVDAVRLPKNICWRRMDFFS